MRPRLVPICLAMIAAATGVPASARAQSHYYNLDGGRPMRVEDAEATARYSLDVDLAPFSVERLTGGTMRYRAEPKASYGVLPFTEVEIRIPYVDVVPPRASGASSTAGVAGLALGALHAFNLETTNVPAIAVAGEVSLPVGRLAPARPSFLAKALLTKTSGIGRFHVNAGLGTYAIRAAAATADTGCVNGATSSLRISGVGGCNNIPIIIDAPCSVHPVGGGGLIANARCMAQGGEPTLATTAASQSRAQPPTYGPHWFAGLGVDHAFPLASTLLTADIVAEKFVRLYPLVDWTAEIGLRREMTPTLVIDGGIGRHFSGTIHSSMLVIGAAYEFATSPLGGRTGS